MKVIVSICKKILIVCGILFIVLLGVVCCDSEEVSNDSANVKQEEIMEHKTREELLEDCKNAKTEEEIADTADALYEYDTRGYVSIVNAYGKAETYSFVGNKVKLIDESYTNAATGFVYMVWENPDMDESIVFATVNEHGKWSIGGGEDFSKIPRGWQNYLNSEMNW